MQLKSFVAMKEVEKFPLEDIDTVLNTYVHPVHCRKDKIRCNHTKNGEISGEFLARPIEAARSCEFRKLETVAYPEQFKIQLRLIVVFWTSRYRTKLLVRLQGTAEAKNIGHVLVNQHREQTIQNVNKLSELTKSGFLSEG